jgi:hypothetical protein
MPVRSCHPSRARARTPPRGVAHASVFGSVASGEARPDSDIDVLVGVFEYARLKLYLAEILNGSTDVVNRKTLKPLLRDTILHQAVDAFQEPRSVN